MVLLALLLLVAASMWFISAMTGHRTWCYLTVCVALGSLNGCILPPPKDYPSEYPPAETTEPCPDLSGTFDNAGFEIPVPPKPKSPPLLTGAIFPPGVVPRGVQVARVRLSGPEQRELVIAGLSADDRLLAESKLAQVSRIQNPPAPAQFVCKGGHIEIITGETGAPSQLGVGFETTFLELFRAKDRSLIVLEEERHSGIGVVVPFRIYKHKWWRYVPAADSSITWPSSTQ